MFRRFLSGARSEVEITSAPKESSALNPGVTTASCRQAHKPRGNHALGGVALIATLASLCAFFTLTSTPAHAETPSVKYQTSSPNPDGRQYELVTPPGKNGALVSSLIARHPPAVMAASGTRVIAPSDQCFAEPEGCTAYRLTEGEPYEFERTSAGWVTHPLAPSASSYEASSPWTVDANAGTALFSAPSSADGPDDFLARAPGGSFANLGAFGEQKPGPGNDQANASQIVANGVLSTEDLSHVVFEAEKSLWTFDESERETVYEYTGTGAPPLMVGVEGVEHSDTLISTCSEHVAGFQTVSKAEALSEDGRTVYFTAYGHDQCEHGAKVPAVTGLYERVDGESADAHTVLVSAPTPSTCSSTECVENTKPGTELEEKAHFRAAKFEGASPDGSRAFFTSTQQLTNGGHEDPNEESSAYTTGCSNIPTEGGCNLYESVCGVPCGSMGEEMGAANREVVDLSEGAGVEGPQVQGVMAIAEDGKHVYFVAKGVLTGAEENANHETAEAGEDNLYLYTGENAKDGHVVFVARLSGTDSQDEQWDSAGENVTANVSPDGRFLVFTADRALTADDTRSEESGEGAAQVYEYDAVSGVITRLSVGEEGLDGEGNEGFGNAYIVPAWRGGAADGSVPVRVDPTMSADGQLVFFESPIALTAGALNDYPIGEGKLAENIYEYFHGQVSLISDGKDTTGGSYTSENLSKAPTELLGVSTTGADVIFSTFDPLVAEDGDTQRDYYDAHVCSTESPCIEKIGEVAPCEGEACQGAPSAPPLFAAPSSATLTGSSGNLAPLAATPPKPKTSVKKATKCRKGFVRKRGKCVKNKKKLKRK